MRDLFITSVLALAAAATSGCASDCDRVASWKSASSLTCGACNLEQCGTQFAAAVGASVTPQCSTEAQCLTSCPRSGNNATYDCSCADRCLRTQACRDAWHAYVQCLASKCDSVCH